ncbi:MAG: hypothetical protein ACFFCW_01370 [Candidatus Hodarchaeota archaeon]
MKTTRKYQTTKAAIWSLFIFLSVPTELIAQEVCVKRVSTDPIWDGVVAGKAPVPSQECDLDPVWSDDDVLPVPLEGALSETSHLYMASRTVGNNKFLYIGFNIRDDGDLSDFDRVLLIFDSDNSGEWNDGDCAVMVSAAAFNVQHMGNEDCQIQAGAIKYWEYSKSDSKWGDPLPSLPTELVNIVSDSRSAYDLSDVPPSDTDEERIWEIELKIPVNRVFTGDPHTYFPLVMGSGEGFGLGVYVFVDKDRQQQPVAQGPDGLALKWPPSIPDRDHLDDDLDFNPPNPGDLGKTFHEWRCFDTRIYSSDVTLNGKAETARLSRTGVNTFEAQLHFEGPGSDPMPLTNSGKVDFLLRPWSTGADWIPIKKDIPVTFTHYNSELPSPIRFNWRVSDLPDPGDRARFNNASGACMWVKLHDFDFNTTAYDSALHNDLIIEASRIQETFLIGTEGVPQKPGQEFAEIYVKLGIENNGRDLKLEPGSFFQQDVNQRRGMFVSCSGCLPILRGYWGYRFPNADKIGLERVGYDLYKLPVRFGEYKQLEYSLIAGRTPYKPVTKTVLARAGESVTDPKHEGTPPVALSVKPGSMVTVIASGTVDLDGDGPLAPIGPGGFTHPDTAAKWLLHRGYYTPRSYAGTLIGSFDENFETSFVIGAEATFVVPENRSTVYLAVNDIALNFVDNVGQFSVGIVATSPGGRTLPTRTPVRPAIFAFGIPAFYEDASNLVRNIIQFYYITSRIINVDGVQRMVTTKHPLGFVRLHVSKSHPIFEAPDYFFTPAYRLTSHASQGSLLLILVPVGISSILARVYNRKYRKRV